MENQVKAILDKIKEYDKIAIFRHFRPDGDAVGSTRGLAEILRATYPDKKIVLENRDQSEYLSFLGGEGERESDEFFADALGLVIDTGTAARISSDRYKLCRELIKIDHHIPVDSYAPLEWVEELRSSACEMIAAFYDVLRDELVMTPRAAYLIYCGMVTDSGRFRYDSTSPRTLALASKLLESKVDFSEIFRNLYADTYENKKLKATFLLKVKFTDNNVAYIYTDKSELASLKIDTFTASRGMVNTMSDIKGVEIWVNFTETDDGVFCEIRSSVYNINPIAVKYGGGGHAKASGCTLKSRDEAMMLLADLNDMIGAKQ